MPRNRARGARPACIATRYGARFRGISASSLRASGLFAVSVRDALGPLLMNLVHGWLLGRCTLSTTPCCKGHAYASRHSLAQLERIQVCSCVHICSCTPHGTPLTKFKLKIELSGASLFSHLCTICEGQKNRIDPRCDFQFQPRTGTYDL